jgi:hypothetical protein
MIFFNRIGYVRHSTLGLKFGGCAALDVLFVALYKEIGQTI